MLFYVASFKRTYMRFSKWKRVADARMLNIGIINDWHMAVAKIVSALNDSMEWREREKMLKKAFKEIFITFMR